MSTLNGIQLLELLRAGPMRRGAIARAQARHQAQFESALERHGVSAELARRIAFQLATRIDPSALAHPALWSELAALLNVERDLLATRIGLADRQIVLALPKLSAIRLIAFHQELMATDRTIARTILNVAIDAADPIAAGRRYLAEYQAIVAQLEAIDPMIARTLANATFTASAPRKKAMQFMHRFADVLAQFKGDGETARMLAKATYREADPCRAAEVLIGEFNATVDQLVDSGVDLQTARTLAGLKHVRGAKHSAARRESGDSDRRIAAARKQLTR